MPNLVSRKERIDALELLGATYVDKKRDMMGALECWKQAMDERFVTFVQTYINMCRNFYDIRKLLIIFVKYNVVFQISR